MGPAMEKTCPELPLHCWVVSRTSRSLCDRTNTSASLLSHIISFLPTSRRAEPNEYSWAWKFPWESAEFILATLRYNFVLLDRVRNMRLKERNSRSGLKAGDGKKGFLVLVWNRKTERKKIPFSSRNNREQYSKSRLKNWNMLLVRHWIIILQIAHKAFKEAD